MSTLAPISIKIRGHIIKTDEMLLGVAVDANLNLNCHLENILKKKNQYKTIYSIYIFVHLWNLHNKGLEKLDHFQIKLIQIIHFKRKMARRSYEWKKIITKPERWLGIC